MAKLPSTHEPLTAQAATIRWAAQGIPIVQNDTNCRVWVEVMLAVLQATGGFFATIPQWRSRNLHHGIWRESESEPFEREKAYYQEGEPPASHKYAGAVKNQYNGAKFGHRAASGIQGDYCCGRCSCQRELL